MSEDRTSVQESLAVTAGLDPRGEAIDWGLEGDRTETVQGSETTSVLAVEVVDLAPVETAQAPPPPPPYVTPVEEPDPPHLTYVQEPNPLLLGTPTTQEPNSQLLVYVQVPPPPPPPPQDSPVEAAQGTFVFDAEIRDGSVERFTDFDVGRDEIVLDDAVVRYLDPRSLEDFGVGDPVIPAVGDPVITGVGDPLVPAEDALHFHAGREASRFVIGESLPLSAEGYFII